MRWVVWMLLCVSLGCEAEVPPPRDAPAPRVAPEAFEDERLRVVRWQGERGMEVIHVPQIGSGVVNVRVVVRTGAIADPKGQEGLANLTAKAVLRGWDGMDRETVTQRLGVMGGRVDYDMEEIVVEFEGEVLSRHAAEYLQEVGRMLARPDFVAEEVEMARRLVLARMSFDLEDDHETAGQHLMHLVYAGHPYGRRLEGNASSVERLSAEVLAAYHRQHYTPANMVWGVAGDMEEGALKALVASIEAELPEGEGRRPWPELPEERPGMEVRLVDKPQRTQNQILMGHRMVPPSHPDYAAMRVANAILGEGYTARLERQLRSEEGLTYGVSSGLWRSAVSSTLVMETFVEPDRAGRAVERILEVYGSLGDGVSEAEVERARRYLVGGYAREVDDAPGLLDEAISAHLYGWTPEMFEGWAERLLSVTRVDVERVVAAYFVPSRMRIVMLCTARHFEARMRSLPGVQSVEVKAYDEAL